MSGSVRKMPPMEIVSRFLYAEGFREMGAEEVKRYNPNLVKEYEEEDEEGVIKTVVEFDWEYVMFDAPIYQLEVVINKIAEEEKAKESSILDINGKPMKKAK